MHKLKEKLMEALYEYEEKAARSQGKISDMEVQKIHILTDTVKNIDKIEALEEGGYSENDGMSYARGRGRNARRDSMGRYSREGGYSEESGSYRGGSYRGGSSYEGGSYRGGSSYGDEMSYARGGQRGNQGGRGGYSRDGAKEHLINKMEDMMEMAESEKERQAIMQCIQKIENA